MLAESHRPLQVTMTTSSASSVPAGKVPGGKVNSENTFALSLPLFCKNRGFHYVVLSHAVCNSLCSRCLSLSLSHCEDTAAYSICTCFSCILEQVLPFTSVKDSCHRSSRCSGVKKHYRISWEVAMFLHSLGIGGPVHCIACIYGIGKSSWDFWIMTHERFHLWAHRNQ